jgi:hypothetical protein
MMLVPLTVGRVAVSPVDGPVGSVPGVQSAAVDQLPAPPFHVSLVANTGVTSKVAASDKSAAETAALLRMDRKIWRKESFICPKG